PPPTPPPIPTRRSSDLTANIKGTVTGTLKDVDPNLTITLDKGFVSGAGVDPPIANLTLRAQVRNGALELEKVSGEWGPATIQARSEEHTSELQSRGQLV